MKILFRIVAVMLFLVFFGFALKNTEEAVLRFFLDYEIRSPLVLLLLAFFAAGAVFGVLAMTPTVFRYRKELSKQKKAAAAMRQDDGPHPPVQVQGPPSRGAANQL